MKPADDIMEAVKRMHVTTRPETDKRILDEAFAALDAAVTGAGSGSTTSGPRIIRLTLGRLAAAAAVLVIGLGLLFVAIRPRGIALDEVLQAVEQAPNVHISRYAAGDTTHPAQEVWVSRDSGLKLYDTRDGRHHAYVLWDLKNGVRSFRQPASDLVARHGMTADSKNRIGKSLTGLLGVLPFNDANSIPEGATWVAANIAPENLPVPDTKAYDLTWTTEGLPNHYRFYVESEKNLPVRIDRYVADAATGAQNVDITQVISLTSDTEIGALVYSVFGPYDPSIELPPTPPSFVGTPSDY